VLGLAAVLTLAAIVGKQACSLGVPARGVDRLTVGLGMVPRGEVGLIFANIGLGLTLAGQPVIDPPTYSALVVMVIVTTMVTPPALQWSLRRAGRRPG
jgi:Kef-type K+ transport system membrane component KefB